MTAPATLRGPADQQVFEASIPQRRLRTLQGRIRVAALVDGTQAGATRTLLRDTVAPIAPRTSLRSGTYRGRQRVALFTKVGNTIRYRLGRGAVAAPRRNSGQVYRGGQILIPGTRTLKAIVIDQAGNVSPVAKRRYVIR